VLLFAGHSGAGKSTLAKIWHAHAPASTILSDDRVLLDPREPSGIPAFGTPWHGTGRFGSRSSGRLRALFFLEQAAMTETIPLHPAEAAARLFTRSFPPIWDREGTGRVVKACGDVAERVPAFLLRFRKDGSAIDTARRAARA
jgi:energy-coupling factor transporter ATP-binding protein EcfA2